MSSMPSGQFHVGSALFCFSSSKTTPFGFNLHLYNVMNGLFDMLAFHLP